MRTFADPDGSTSSDSLGSKSAWVVESPLVLTGRSNGAGSVRFLGGALAQGYADGNGKPRAWQVVARQASDVRKSRVDNALTSVDRPAMECTMTLIPEAARARS